MDTITHTLIGLTINGSVKKEKLPLNLKKSIFFATLTGSQIPDIDIVLQLTERGRIMYQMWHRGLSHSLFMAPIWALLIYLICYLLWKVKDIKVFLVALLCVSLHIGFDALNTWGTGLFEPFSTKRVSIGIISIVDFVLWIIMLIGFIITKVMISYPKYRVWHYVWLVIILYISFQFLQGQIIYNEAKLLYDNTAISANYLPGHFKVIGKSGNKIEIYSKTIFSNKKNKIVLESMEAVDLTPLLTKNPKAAVLFNWSPFVVIYEDENEIGIYDPRFYQDDSSFLREYIKKTENHDK